MLAQNFKTAADLGISDKEFGALVKVLGMFEREEIGAEHFGMGSTGYAEFWDGETCVAPACICGWARHVSDDKSAFRPYGDKRPLGLQALFMMGRGPVPAYDPSPYKATPAQAALAIRNYLTHGDPRWDEAMAG